MTPFEYALGLISILMSLALADVVMCVHRLMRRARTVRWDARPLIATALIVIEIIRIWFAQWTLRDLDTALGFPVYVALFGHILLLVMTAVASLPDEVGDRCDLGEFYERNRTYFWGAFAATQAAYFALWLVFGGNQASVGGSAGVMDWFRILGPLAVYLLLALVRWKWLHYLAPLVILGFYAWLYRGQTISM
ncbi:hypothetical protein [Phenylobacterium sp.]|jgi:hypothetical protein|uniref:hypothetical protein n=1 Tax=Phenylobacterium sp. TaxID=1871053 RepID=UPI002F94C389